MVTSLISLDYPTILGYVSFCWKLRTLISLDARKKRAAPAPPSRPPSPKNQERHRRTPIDHRTKSTEATHFFMSEVHSLVSRFVSLKHW